MTENSPLYRTVRKMRSTGNQPGVVELWKNMVAHWAAQSNSADAEAVKAWLPMWQSRPFYTAAELAPIMPAIMAALGVHTFSGRLPPIMAPARLAHELIFAQMPWVCVGGTQYFIVEQMHRAQDMIPQIEEYHYAQHG